MMAVDDLSMAMAMIDRRRFLGGAALGAVAAPALARQSVDLHLPGGDGGRPTTDAFPGKKGMILQRVRPPLLETPMSVFDRDIFTPNDRFFVRWHWATIPTAIDVDTFRLAVTGHVERPLSIGLGELLAMPRIEYAAVNQCSGNSRGFFEPRVPGAQWGHGAMGNARWVGVRLKDILDRAGVKARAVQVRVGGLDRPVVADAPRFLKSLDLDHARDGEVMVAFQMNGEQLPLLNGFPCRLVVPGWYSTYWVKALSSIEVLGAPDDQYWMAKAYRIPATARAAVVPGASGFATAPIGRMVPRSWLTSHAEGARVAVAPSLAVGGIAMGGDCGVAKVEVSTDGGARWTAATLGPDRGRYGFRRWDASVAVALGSNRVMSRCTNTRGEAQPLAPIWNPGGYQRDNVETTTMVAA